jgi:hypothetical protein
LQAGSLRHNCRLEAYVTRKIPRAADILTEIQLGNFGHGRQQRKVPSPRRIGSAARSRRPQRHGRALAFPRGIRQEIIYCR